MVNSRKGCSFFSCIYFLCDHHFRLKMYFNDATVEIKYRQKTIKGDKKNVI